MLPLAWTLLQPHVHRPGRIVTPDLLVTRAQVMTGGPGGPQPLALARIRTLPVVQLEAGIAALAPAVARIDGAEQPILLPGLALLAGGACAWLVLGRDGLALDDIATPLAVALDEAPPAVIEPPPLAPRPPEVTLSLRLGASAPVAGRAAVTLRAAAGAAVLPPLRVALEPLAPAAGVPA